MNFILHIIFFLLHDLTKFCATESYCIYLRTVTLIRMTKPLLVQRCNPRGFTLASMIDVYGIVLRSGVWLFGLLCTDTCAVSSSQEVQPAPSSSRIASCVKTIKVRHQAVRSH